MIKNKVYCPKRGNWRYAISCVIDDRYKTCRKTCSPLEELIKNNGGFIEEARKNLKLLRRKKCGIFKDFSSHKQAFKNLPNFDFACRKFSCGFIAKTGRGLKSHLTRSHGRGAQ